MANEVTPWKKPGCELQLRVDNFTNREENSREINEKYGEGGALNANYKTVEAIAIVANMLGYFNMYYGEHFVFKVGGYETIIFDFRDEETQIKAERILRANENRTYLQVRGSK